MRLSKRAVPKPHQAGKTTFNRDEWREVARKVRPDLTDAEFDAMFNEAIRANAQRRRRGDAQ